MKINDSGHTFCRLTRSHAVGGAIEYLREIEVEVISAQVHRRCAFLEQLVLRLSLWCGHIYEL